jgi:CRP-like cAMP-binding protein
LAPVVIELVGIRGALVAIGLVGPACIAAALPALGRLDSRMRVRDADIRLLQMVPMLRPLPQATIEQLAATLEHATFTVGERVLERGEIGDKAYVIEAGAADVLRDGRVVKTLRRGDCFGEIALLRGCARSATVSASTTMPVEVAILPRDRFLTAVTGHTASAAVAEQAVASRLRALLATGD